MVQKGSAEAKTNEVTYMSDELGLHRVENPSHSNRAVSLHLYSPPFKSCQVSLNTLGHECQQCASAAE